VQPGSVHGALGPTSGNSLGPRSLSAQQTKTGDLTRPPSPAWLHRPIPVGQRWLTGEGGSGEEAWTKGNPWVAVGWMEAHHSGVSTAVVPGRWGNDGAGLEAGSRCSGTGRRVAGCSGEAIAGIGRAGGQLVRAVERRCSAAGEWWRRLRLRPEVIDGDGVDEVQLQT
jgi:hypothetical protein